MITRDGCAVEVYRKMRYRNELELLAAHLPPSCSVLELGCGSGRLTQPLLARGHAVTAVDNSLDMLEHVPAAAIKICCDIEDLQLNRSFDVVLYASNLINVGDDSACRAQLAACRRHLSSEGALLFQRFDPVFLRAVASGPFRSGEEVDITIERAVHRGNCVDLSIRYTIGDAEWKHHFTARVLDDDDVNYALNEAELSAAIWIETRWGMAKVLE